MFTSRTTMTMARVLCATEISITGPTDYTGNTWNHGQTEAKNQNMVATMKTSRDAMPNPERVQHVHNTARRLSDATELTEATLAEALGVSRRQARRWMTRWRDAGRIVPTDWMLPTGRRGPDAVVWQWIND